MRAQGAIPPEEVATVASLLLQQTAIAPSCLAGMRSAGEATGVVCSGQADSKGKELKTVFLLVARCCFELPPNSRVGVGLLFALTPLALLRVRPVKQSKRAIPLDHLCSELPVMASLTGGWEVSG